MTLKSLTFALGFTLLGGLLATGAGALAGARHDGDRRERIEQLLEELDLTEAQKADARELRERVHEQRQDLRDDRRGRADDLAELLSARKLDRSAVHALVNEGVAERAKAADAMTNELLDFYATLSPEQQKIIVDRLDELAQNEDGPR